MYASSFESDAKLLQPMALWVDCSELGQGESARYMLQTYVGMC